MFWIMGMMYVYNWWGLLYPTTIIYILSYSLGMGGTSLTYVIEILPPLGVSVTIGSQSVFTGLISLLIPILAKDEVLGVLP